MAIAPRKQGFAAMDPERLRQIAAAGGRAKRKYPLEKPMALPGHSAQPPVGQVETQRPAPGPQ